MYASLIAAVAALATAVAAPAPVPLSPGTAAAHGYHVQCGPLGGTERPDGTVVVQVRFGRLPGGAAADLAPIKSASLEVRDGDATLLAVPVRTEVDPGNRLHLAFQFRARKDLLPRTRLVIDEDGPRGARTFTVDLAAFIGKK